MEISFSKQNGRVPVTIMHLTGNVDASNYTDVIAKAQESFDGGVRDLLIDLSKVPYVSSAGLMSLHAVVLIFSGNSAKSKEGGRPSFRSIDPQRDDVGLHHVKLLSPQTAVEQVLDVVGLKQFLNIHTDLETAVQSY
ncbi:MAG TPA: STAS domain-containing protein [Anaerolineales bacterium]|nr:STAS domain-containing protein [Anaerolineales bacterium]